MLTLRLVVVSRFVAVQKLGEKAKLLRKEAKGVQHMVMKDEVNAVYLRLVSLFFMPSSQRFGIACSGGTTDFSKSSTVRRNLNLVVCVVDTTMEKLSVILNENCTWCMPVPFRAFYFGFHLMTLNHVDAKDEARAATAWTL